MVIRIVIIYNTMVIITVVIKEYNEVTVILRDTLLRCTCRKSIENNTIAVKVMSAVFM